MRDSSTGSETNSRVQGDNKSGQNVSRDVMDTSSVELSDGKDLSPSPVDSRSSVRSETVGTEDDGDKKPPAKPNKKRRLRADHSSLTHGETPPQQQWGLHNEASSGKLKRDNVRAMEKSAESTEGAGLAVNLAASNEVSCDPQPADVMFGRGRTYVDNPGNRRMQLLVDIHRVEYEHSDRDEKTDITRNIVAIIQQQGGRFLRKVAGDIKWTIVSDEIARQKVSHLMRDSKPRHVGYNASQLRELQLLLPLTRLQQLLSYVPHAAPVQLNQQRQSQALNQRLLLPQQHQHQQIAPTLPYPANLLLLPTMNQAILWAAASGISQIPLQRVERHHPVATLRSTDQAISPLQARSARSPEEKQNVVGGQDESIPPKRHRSDDE